MSDDLNYDDLVKAKCDMETCVERMQRAQFFYETNSNYRQINQVTNRKSEADCYLHLGEIKRNLLIALRYKAVLEGKYSEEMRANQREWTKTAPEDIEEAIDIFQDLKMPKGEADAAYTLGMFYHTAVKDLPKCKEFWTKASEVYTEANETQRMKDVEEELRALEVEMDAVATIQDRIKALQSGENKEEQAVRAAFEKFDTDGSGTMEITEFNQLAGELGTFPPLSKAELAEAIEQIDNSMDGQITFDEFWAWWIADELEKAGSI